jgi:hypothetical protein
MPIQPRAFNSLCTVGITEMVDALTYGTGGALQPVPKCRTLMTGVNNSSGKRNKCSVIIITCKLIVERKQVEFLHTMKIKSFFFRIYSVDNLLYKHMVR